MFFIFFVTLKHSCVGQIQQNARTKLAVKQQPKSIHSVSLIESVLQNTLPIIIAQRSFVNSLLPHRKYVACGIQILNPLLRCSWKQRRAIAGEEREFPPLVTG